MSLAPEAVHPDHELQHKHADTSERRDLSPAENAPSHLGGMFAAVAAEGSSDKGARRLLSNPVMRQKAGSQARVLAMRSVQQGFGNQKAQRLIAQLSRSSDVQNSVIQRECACGGTCSSCQGKATEEESETAVVHRQSNSDDAAPQASADVIPADSPGHPLEQGTRGFMESRFGHDFSDVRVHTDSRAAESADALAANAYTTGRDIYFGAGKYAPESKEGQHLLAHELTHTVQQEDLGTQPGIATQRQSIAVGAPDSPMENEADQAADQVVSDRGAGVSISADRTAPIRRGVLGKIWHATGGRVVNYVEGKAEAAIEYAEDWIVEKIEKYAPGLLTLLRKGPVEYLKDKIVEVLDSHFGGVTEKVQKEGFLGAAAETIGEHAASLGKAASGLLAGACESFAHAAGIVTTIVKAIAGSVFDGIRKVGAAVGKFFGDLWTDVVAPAWNAVKSVAGAVWNFIEEKAKWIWDKTEPIRRALSRVWHWILDKFGVVWDSGAGVFDWLKGKLKAAWDKVYEFTKPIHGALKIVGGVLLIISGIGPIIAIWKGAPMLWDALTWLYAQWKKTDFIVLARQALTEHILPAISSGAQKAADLIGAAADWMTEKVDAIDAALGGLLKALGISAILKFALSAVQFVADAFRKFANWVKTGFLKTLRKLQEILLKIWAFVKPILAFLIKLAIVVSNPLLLPIVLTGYMWQILPDCFKPPIIDFVLDLLIALVRAIPTFKSLGEAWPAAKTKILGSLTELRHSSVEKKIEASNRVARIMSGDDLDWVGNLLSAMIKVPDYIEGQFEEELIGMDLTEPLPFERSAAPRTAEIAAQSAAAGTMTAEDALVLSNPNLGQGQIGVENVAEMKLEPELIADLQAQGGEKEFRGPDDPSRSIKGIQAELSGGETPGAAAAPPGPDAAVGAPQAGSSGISTDDQLETFMNQPAPDTCTQEKTQKSDVGGSIPEELKIGPLTRSQRAKYLLHQIGQGIKTWFHCNSTWLVPAIIGVVAVLIALEILTGGAITAALPEVLEIMTAVMIGVAAVRVAAYMAEYVAKAIAGDVVGGAKSLARGLAVAAIEIIFALLFNLDKVIKTLKQGLKATAEAAAKAAKAAVKGTIESVENLGRIATKGVRTAGRNIAGFGRAIIKNGKLLMEGVGEGFAKGIRKVEELFERLWNKLRFKAFRLRLSGAWFTLEGEINPWILLAKGKIKWVEDAEIIEGKGAKIGEKVVARQGGEEIEGLLAGGSRLKPDYRKIIDLFLEQAASKLNVIHHAIEQQVLKRFPKLFTLEEIHAAENLRTILRGAFNSEVHLSKIRILWNDFYTLLEDAKLPREGAREAFANFRNFVDEYIVAMKDFLATNKAAIEAEEKGDKEALRALLAEESQRLLKGTKNAAQKAIDSGRAVTVGG